MGDVRIDDYIAEIDKIWRTGGATEHSYRGAPDGSKDDNVFDIMQGVCIGLFVKCANVANVANSQPPISNVEPQRSIGNWKLDNGNTCTLATLSHSCTIRYADLYGKRAEKFAFLDSHDFDSVPWRTITPQAPYFFFVPKDFSLEEEYNKGLSVAELFSCFGLGVKTERDDVAIHFSMESLSETISDFASMEVEAIRSKYHLGKDSRDWSIERAKKDVLAHRDFDKYAKPMLVRCFDTRWTLYSGTSKGFIGTPAYPTMQHMLLENVALCLIRNSRGHDAILPFVADVLVGKDAVSSLDNCRVFPLYLYREYMGKLVREPNLNPEIVAKIEEILSRKERIEDNPAGKSFAPSASFAAGKTTPEDILHYVYAVLHSPSYRARYREFLKVDFPRIPYPADGEGFRRLAAIGAKLVETHLMRDPPPPLSEKTAAFPVAGTNLVEETRFSQNRVYINGAQYFDNVPETAWEFFIGGYQPAQKWLKDRKGRALSADDILHYRRIILALLRTVALTAELRKEQYA